MRKIKTVMGTLGSNRRSLWKKQALNNHSQLGKPRLKSKTNSTFIGEKLDQNSVPEVDDKSDLEPQEKTSRFNSQPLAYIPARNHKGPRTAKEKAIASRNALKHGIFSNAMLLTLDSRADYDSLLSGLREDLKPIGTLEDVLVEKLPVLIWRYRRLINTETAEIKGGGNTLGFNQFQTHRFLIAFLDTK